MFKVGDFVCWRECPGHLSAFARGQIQEVKGDKARLRWFASFHRMSEMDLIEPTEIEQRRNESYRQAPEA
ncbi:hypothetical protein [Leptolyngbya sp. FACHB-17]|uniref:hypothetical protein n=1 Tax=unclassified Leptolyngbya TaxID=2650499 RepID=UPI00168192F2|nr:hypothetical protein [Leptolyngbya sp. FACHB-17]MBD2078791.1 hypothetical protein [Leptolyngbya sp. FACHB-17]